MQAIVDSYWTRVEPVCKRHEGCFTDHAQLERFMPTDRDLSWDPNPPLHFAQNAAWLPSDHHGWCTVGAAWANRSTSSDRPEMPSFANTCVR